MLFRWKREVLLIWLTWCSKEKLLSNMAPRLRVCGYRETEWSCRWWGRSCDWFLWGIWDQLKTWCKWHRFESNMNVRACGHSDDTTRAAWRHVMYFLCFITSEEGPTIDFSCIWFCCNKVYPWNSRCVLWTQTASSCATCSFVSGKASLIHWWIHCEPLGLHLYWHYTGQNLLVTMPTSCGGCQ